VEQERLQRCLQCGQLRGEAFVDGGRRVPVACLCEGIVCRVCRERAIRRPLSNYWDEETGRVWHVPWFAYLRPCAPCRRAAGG